MEIFDLDNTICESRQVISPEMKEKLRVRPTFIVISGGEKKRIEKQMDGLPCIIMGQNGNEAPDWYNKLTPKEILEIHKHLHQISRHANIPVDAVTTQNRGCQISFSFTGHDADVNWKKLFDPNGRYRTELLKEIPFKSKTLMVRVAGTTCLDYNRKGNLKGDNLKRYMKLHLLKKEDCIYYGDNFKEGGNDESVLGVMKCIEVKNPTDLLNIL